MNARAKSLLQELGLTRYEASAYTALLGCQPATAYEVAKAAGIPTSKVYETMDRLRDRHLVMQTSEGEQGKRYMPLPPSDLTHQLVERTRNRTEELLPLLEAERSEQPSDLIWPLASESEIQDKAIQLIEESEHSLLLSAWPEELSWLDSPLRAAESRNVRIALVHFGAPGTRIGATYHHPVEQTLYAEKGGRGLTLVADHLTVLIANYPHRQAPDGAWSHNRGFVTVAEDYVKHDVYITKVTRFLNDEMQARFGPNYERLRDVFDADA